MNYEKLYEEHIMHQTVELPIALHLLDYPDGTDNLFYLHWHKEFELLVVTKGCIEFTIQDRIYKLGVNDGVFISSGIKHSAKALNQKHCCFFALDFSYEFLEPDIHTHFAREYIRPLLEGHLIFPEFIHLDPSSPNHWQSQIIYYLHEINNCANTHLMSHELMVKTRIYQIWELLFQHATHSSNKLIPNLAHQNRLAPVLDFIHENYADEMTLTHLSNLLPMSKAQFCRVFKETMKVSPFQYIMRYRILKSCNLLLETNKKIGEIANLSGFNNISYYNKIFLKIIGCSPKQYRLSYSDRHIDLTPPTH